MTRVYLPSSSYKKCLALGTRPSEWPCAPTVCCSAINRTLVDKNKLISFIFAYPSHVFKPFRGWALSSNTCNLTKNIRARWSDVIEESPFSLWIRLYEVFATLLNVKPGHRSMSPVLPGVRQGTSQVLFESFQVKTIIICDIRCISQVSHLPQHRHPADVCFPSFRSQLASPQGMGCFR